MNGASPGRRRRRRKDRRTLSVLPPPATGGEPKIQFLYTVAIARPNRLGGSQVGLEHAEVAIWVSRRCFHCTPGAASSARAGSPRRARRTVSVVLATRLPRAQSENPWEMQALASFDPSFRRGVAKGDTGVSCGSHEFCLSGLWRSRPALSQHPPLAKARGLPARPSHPKT